MNFTAKRMFSLALLAVGSALGLVLLYLASRSNYLLFHVCVESYAIVVGFCVSVVAINQQTRDQDGSFTFMGVAFAAVGILTVFHMASYKGMGVFPGVSANVATQFWVASRYLHAVSLLVSLAFAGRRAKLSVIGPVMAGICLMLTLSILVWRVFPVCFVDGVGLTAFKKASEYVIIALLGAYAVLVWRRRSWLEPSTRQRIVVSTLFLMAAEFAFTQYRDTTGTANALGHILLCVSFTFTYSAFVEATLRRPLRNLFGTLARSEERYRSLFENAPLAK